MWQEKNILASLTCTSAVAAASYSERELVQYQAASFLPRNLDLRARPSNDCCRGCCAMPALVVWAVRRQRRIAYTAAAASGVPARRTARHEDEAIIKNKNLVHSFTPEWGVKIKL